MDEIDEEIKLTQKLIVKHIGTEWSSSQIHMQFVTRLTSQKNRAIWDLFSLNYDTLIEASLEEQKLSFTDGFRGSENAYFDPSLYNDIPNASKHYFRLYKLHGSINWVRQYDDTVRRRPIREVSDLQPAMVYPAEQKYLQTQYGVYETLLGLFRKRLRENRPNNKLVVLGYSFNDEHINLAIEDSVRAEGSNLTVFAFLGPEADIDAQTKRLNKIAERCDDRFNAFIGNQSAIGLALEADAWDRIKALDLWKFENMIELIIKGKL